MGMFNDDAILINKVQEVKIEYDMIFVFTKLD